uniref:Uncharacterized protein n=1 Tax=Romanomermis culicivorax TaxID=13658 RepID=A0A915IYS4_ROMCU
MCNSTFNCIPYGKRCNGEFDCQDSSDEAACQVIDGCLSNQFSCRKPAGICVAEHRVCDGAPDCLDGSDEAFCLSYCREEPTSKTNIKQALVIVKVEAEQPHFLSCWNLTFMQLLMKVVVKATFLRFKLMNRADYGNLIACPFILKKQMQDRTMSTPEDFCLLNFDNLTRLLKEIFSSNVHVNEKIFPLVY